MYRYKLKVSSALLPLSWLNRILHKISFLHCFLYVRNLRRWSSYFGRNLQTNALATRNTVSFFLFFSLSFFSLSSFSFIYLAFWIGHFGLHLVKCKWLQNSFNLFKFGRVEQNNYGSKLMTLVSPLQSIHFLSKMLTKYYKLNHGYIHICQFTAKSHH